MWDTSGQERFAKLSYTFYKNAMGIILAYAIDDRDSFKRIKFWLDQVNELASKDVRKLLVGTKIDLTGRKVKYNEGLVLAEEHGMAFFETSAIENFNVEEVMFSIAKDIKHNLLNKEEVSPWNSRATERPSGVRLSAKPKKSDKSCCSK